MLAATLETKWRDSGAAYQTLCADLRAELGPRWKEGHLALNDEQNARAAAAWSKVAAAYSEYDAARPPPVPEPPEPDPLDSFLHRRQIERERDIPLDDIVPADARLAVPISSDVAESLIYHARDEMPWVRAGAIAWDLRRLFGAEGGLDLFDTALWILDGDEDETSPVTNWPAFDRPREPGDTLLIDLADDATHRGWIAPVDIATALDRLRTIAEQAPTRREAAEWAELAAEEDRKHEQWRQEQYALRDAAQAEWLAFGGTATQQQLDAWKAKFAGLALGFTVELKPVNVLPFPTPAQPAPPTAVPALSLTFFDECRDRAPKRWIHKGVFALGENSSVYGAPGMLKSSLLTDIAVNAAAGTDWRGFKCKAKCGVVYFAFERADQVRRRLAAYAKRDGLTDLPIAVAGTLVNMLDISSVDVILATIRVAEERFGLPVGLAIFDTWSKGIAAGGGDEDKARDQNIVAANLRRVHEHIAVHIAGVGHSGKDETRGERGSNARQGDIDLGVYITGTGDTKTATIVKANDQAEGPLTSFAGEVINLGADADGDAVTSFILSTRIFSAVQPTSKLSDRQVLALDALKRATQEHGKRVDGVQSVEVDHWREEMFRAGVLDREATNPRQDFKRLRDTLARMRRIVEKDGQVRMGHAAPIGSITGQ